MTALDRTDPRVLLAAAQVARGTMLSTKQVLDAVEAVTQSFETMQAAADQTRLAMLRLAEPLAEVAQQLRVPRTPREQPYANPAKLARQERRHGGHMRPGR